MNTHEMALDAPGTATVDAAQLTAGAVYASPVLVELGGFTERTLGCGLWTFDADGTYALPLVGG